jgi:hypothetical protein
MLDVSIDDIYMQELESDLDFQQRMIDERMAWEYSLEIERS